MENTIVSEKNNNQIGDIPQKSSIKEWVKFGLILMFVMITIPNTIGLTVVSGYSMVPTLHDGNVVLEEKISKYISSPEMGDVVIINRQDMGYKIVKRVIGVGGDTVKIKDGVVFINDQPIPEIMIEGKPEDMATVNVPENHLFVMGDNRTPGESIDSRDSSVGVIPLSSIDGNVLISLLPFKKISKPISIE